MIKNYIELDTLITTTVFDNLNALESMVSKTIFMSILMESY